MGTIQLLEVLILVDSGSSSTFISSCVAEKLKGASLLAEPVNVKVADGGLLQCSSQFN